MSKKRLVAIGIRRKGETWFTVKTEKQDKKCPYNNLKSSPMNYIKRALKQNID